MEDGRSSTAAAGHGWSRPRLGAGCHRLSATWDGWPAGDYCIVIFRDWQVRVSHVSSYRSQAVRPSANAPFAHGQAVYVSLRGPRSRRAGDQQPCAKPKLAPHSRSGSGSICRAVRGPANPKGAVLVGPAFLRSKWSGRISGHPAGRRVDQLASLPTRAVAHEHPGPWPTHNSRVSGGFSAWALTSMLFNYILGEELLFRGVLLPRMNGVFGRWMGREHGALRPVPRAQDLGYGPA